MSSMSEFREIVERVHLPSPAKFVQSLGEWVEENWRFWCISAAVHGGVLCLLVLTLGVIVAPRLQLPALFDAAKDNVINEGFARVDPSHAPLDPSVLNRQSLISLDRPDKRPNSTTRPMCSKRRAVAARKRKATASWLD